MPSRPATDDEQHLTLADGRHLFYLELGDPDGTPLLWCHGGLSSNLDGRPAAAAAQARGIRLVAPNRPGVGRSTRSPNRPMAGFADDAAELADQLGVDRLAVMGWSLGGGFAQAVAAGLGDRVTALTLVASVIPHTWSGMKRELNRMDRLFMGLDGRGAKVDRGLLRAMRLMARHAPNALARAGHLPAEDADAITEAIEEGLRHAAGVVDEYRAMSSPWGFDPAEIAVPTSIWQGDADDLVPASWGRRLAAAIPDADLHVVGGGTHYLAYQHWDELLDPLAAG